MAQQWLEWKSEKPVPKDAWYPTNAAGDQEQVCWRSRPYTFGKVTAHINSPTLFKFLQAPPIVVPYDGPFNVSVAPDDVGEVDWDRLAKLVVANTTPEQIAAAIAEKPVVKPEPIVAAPIPFEVEEPPREDSDGEQEQVVEEPAEKKRGGWRGRPKTNKA